MEKNPQVRIIYDGDCPFCNNFVSLSKLRDLGYAVTLINAREDDSLVVRRLSKSYDLDDGMIVMVDDQVLYGPAAARFLASGFLGGGGLSCVYRILLRGERVSKLIYPILVRMRKLYFRLAGKTLINDDS